MQRVSACQQDEANIREALEAVVARYFYIDTLVVLLRRPLLAADLATLRSLNGGAVWNEGTEAFRVGYLSKITMHQPTNEGISFLADLRPSSYVISKVHTALDLITPTREIAEELQSLLRKHIVQPWRGKKRETNLFEEETDYYSRNGDTTRNIVIYSDQLSKLTSEPVVHIEFRTHNADTCRNYGMRRFNDFETIDLAKVASRHSRLASLDWKRLEPTLDVDVGRYMLKRTLASGQRYSRSQARLRYYGWLAGILGHFGRGIDGHHLKDAHVQDWVDHARVWPAHQKAVAQAVETWPIDILLAGAVRAPDIMIKHRKWLKSIKVH